MLWYQTGFFGAPPSEATTAYSPLCSTRISGVLRSLLVLAPTVVSRMMGLPFISAASDPPDSAYLSACSRDQSQGLGAYSPVSGIPTTLGGSPPGQLPDLVDPSDGGRDLVGELASPLGDIPQLEPVDQVAVPGQPQ